jgi:hypothetical protein
MSLHKINTYNVTDTDFLMLTNMSNVCYRRHLNQNRSGLIKIFLDFHCLIIVFNIKLA